MNVQCCPKCGSSEAYERITAPEPERWRCPACKATFRRPFLRGRLFGPTSDAFDALEQSSPEDLSVLTKRADDPA